MTFASKLTSLGNLKIGGRIALALAIPALGIIIFGGMLLIEKKRVANDMANVEHLAELAPVVSGLVHELQKERGISAGFLGSKGAKFSNELKDQRVETNASRGTLAKAFDGFDASHFPPEFAKSISSSRDALSVLGQKRADVDGMKMTVPEMAKYYTSTIASLLKIVEDMAVLSTNAEVTNLITTYTSLLQGKERAGIERAMGSGGFSAGTFSPAIHKKFIELIAAQQAYLSQFAIYATKAQKALYDTTITGEAVDEVARMRKIAIDSAQTGDTGGIEGAYWFKNITVKINLLKKVEDAIASDLKTRAAEIGGNTNTAFLMVLAVSFVLLAIGGAVVYATVRGITRPVAGMTEAMRELANGNLEAEIPAKDRHDEIGAMAEAVQIFKDNGIERVRLQSDSKKEQEARAAREKRVDELISNFREVVQGVLQTVSTNTTQMESTAKALSSIATQTTAQASGVSAASEEASANVQAVAAASEELSASITEISRQITQTKDVVVKASKATTDTNVKISGLADAAQKIGEVISLIQDIAEQTNLLALNATIEAARAGEAGKGFAVVASEVKELATQTAKATEAIAEQITSIQNETDSSVDAIRVISETMTEVSAATEAIAAAIEEQGASTSEISNNVQQAAAGSNEVAQNITGVSQAADESQQSADQVLSASQEVAGNADKLHNVVDEFLKEVAAA